MSLSEAIANALIVSAILATTLAMIFAFIAMPKRPGLVRDRMTLAGWLAVTAAVILGVSAAWVGFLGSVG